MLTACSRGTRTLSLKKEVAAVLFLDSVIHLHGSVDMILYKCVNCQRVCHTLYTMVAIALISPGV